MSFFHESEVFFPMKIKIRFFKAWISVIFLQMLQKFLIENCKVTLFFLIFHVDVFLSIKFGDRNFFRLVFAFTSNFFIEKIGTYYVKLQIFIDFFLCHLNKFLLLVMPAILVGWEMEVSYIHFCNFESWPLLRFLRWF